MSNEQGDMLRNSFPPWAVAIAGTLVGSILVGLSYTNPGLRNFMNFPTVSVVLAICLLTMAWSVAGFLKRNQDGHTLLCVLSFVWTLGLVGTTGYLLWQDPLVKQILGVNG